MVGRGKSIAAAIYDAIRETLPDGELVIGSDGTALLMEANRDTIFFTKEMIGRPFQWTILLLYFNELPLKHIFVELDESTVGPNAFSSPIGKSLVGPVSNWEVNNFLPIPNPTFPVLPQPLLEDLSSNQHYSYGFF